MMNAPDDSQAWGYIRAGIRPSTVLACGAVLTFLAPLLALWPATSAAGWILWGISLVVVGVGFLVSGLKPWFSTVGIVVGVFYLLHAACLVMAMTDNLVASLAYRIMAVPKLLSLILLVPVSGKFLAPYRRVLLGFAGLAGAVKVALRVMDVLPDQGADLIDFAVNTLVAAALLMVARGLRRRENEWAHRAHELSSASFADFNQK